MRQYDFPILSDGCRICQRSVGQQSILAVTIYNAVVFVRKKAAG